MVKTCNQRASSVAIRPPSIVANAILAGAHDGEEASVTPTEKPQSLKVSPH